MYHPSFLSSSLRRIGAFALSLALLLQLSPLGMLPRLFAAVSPPAPNPTFIAKSNIGGLATSINIEWSTTKKKSGDHSVHVFSDGTTTDYAMVGIPTDFTLTGDTEISYWGYTESGSDVLAPDEIFLEFKPTGVETIGEIIINTSAQGTVDLWDEWTLSGSSNWYKYNQNGAIDIANYYGRTVVNVYIGAGSPTSSGVNVNVYLDNLIVDENSNEGSKYYTLDDDTGTIDVLSSDLGNTGIQVAIDAAFPGTIINVAAGTYYEAGQIVIDKNLTIVGEDKDTTIIKPNHDTTVAGYVQSDAWIYVPSDVTFTLSKVTLDGTDLEGAPRIIRHAIQSRGELTVEDCIVKNISTNNKYYGRGIVLLSGASNAITRCEFSDIQRIGIHVRGSAIAELSNPVATITDCTYTGKGNGDWLDYGIEFGGGGSGTVDNCDISACTGVASIDDSTSAGILATNYYGEETDAVIQNSRLTENTSGIVVGYETDDATSLAAHGNTFSKNIDFGIENVGVTKVDATNNDWGHCSGPFYDDPAPDPLPGDPDNPYGLGDAVSDNVDFNPWIGQDTCWDFGDAPDAAGNYPTLLAYDGARHLMGGSLFLGTEIDAEADGQPSSNATGDDNNGTDDEDGVVFTSNLVVGSTQASVDVTASADGELDAWIDFDGSGVWDAGEQIFKNESVSIGVNHLTFSVPVGAAIGTTFARFRLSFSGNLAPDGAADDGEVEDYLVTIEDDIDVAGSGNTTGNVGSLHFNIDPGTSGGGTLIITEHDGEPDDPPPSDSGFSFAGNYFDIESTMTNGTFLAELTFHYTEDSGSNPVTVGGVLETELRASYYNTTTSKWEMIFGTLDTDANTYAFTVNHFTPFSLVGTNMDVEATNNFAPVTVQSGTQDVGILDLVFTNTTGSTDKIEKIVVTSKNDNDADTANVKLYKDVNGNGILEPGTDTLLRTETFSGSPGTVIFNGTSGSIPIPDGATLHVFIAYDVAALGTATEGNTLDAKIKIGDITMTNSGTNIEALDPTGFTTIDNVAPTVTLTDNDDDDIVKAGDIVIFTAEFSETMANVPQISITSTPCLDIIDADMTFVSGTIWNYTWTAPTCSDSTDPTVYIAVSGDDLAGNEYAGGDQLQFIYDNTSPSITVNEGTDTGPVQTDTINVTVSDFIGVISSDYGFSGDATCDSGDFTAFTHFDSGVDFYIAGNRTNWLCVRAIDDAGHISYELVGPGPLNTDNIAPTIKNDAAVDSNNTYITINFNDANDIYSNFPGTDPLNTGDFLLVFDQAGGTATGATMTSVTKTDGTPLVGGEMSVRVYFDISTPPPSGDETIEIKAIADSIYDEAGNPMLDTQTTGAIPLKDKTNPIVSSVDWINVDSDTAISAGDKFIVTFSEAINTGTITAGALDADLGLSSHTFGTTPVIAWNGSDTILTITSGSNSNIVHGDTINPADSVTDVAGNIDATNPAVPIEDDMKPTLNPVSIAPALVKVNDVVTLSFTASEPLQNVVVMIDGKAADSVTNTGNISFNAYRTMQTGDTEGVIGFTIDFEDSPAGNAGIQVTGTTDSSSTIFDETAPTLTMVTPVPNPTNNQTPSYTFNSDEAGAITYSGSCGNATPVSAIDGNTTITYSTTLAAGTYNNCTITVTDATGNVSDPLAVNEFTIDLTDPALTTVSIASDNTDTTLAKVGDTVTVSFIADETIQTPTVTIDSNLADAVTSTGGNTWEATRIMKTGDTAGVVAFTINFNDLAGNGGTTATGTTDLTSVTFDETVPVLTVVTPVPTPTNDTTPSYTFNSTETGAITYGGSCGNATPISAINGDTTITFGTLADGTYNNCTITVTDATGNVSDPLAVNEFTIDLTDPTLTTVSIAPPLVKVDETVTLSFTADEPIQNVGVTFSSGGNPIGGSTTIINTGGNDWTVAYTTQSGDTDGLVLFTIVYDDMAGNDGDAISATTDSSSTTVDKTVPILNPVLIVSNNIDPQYAQVGDIVTLSFTADEKIQTPTVTIDGKAADSITDMGGNAWTATRTMQTGDSEAVIAFTIVSTDLAGNAGTTIATTDSTSWVIFDETVPTATFSPSDGATGVAVDTNLVITFGEYVKMKTGTAGKITIKKSCDDSLVEEIAIDGGQVVFDDDTVTINPTDPLADSTSHYILIDADAITDLAGNNYAGIPTDKTGWNFLTVFGVNGGNIITLAPGWNVFSTPRLLNSIEFSNGGTGISFYKLEGGVYDSNTTAATTTNVKPLEGFLVQNINTASVDVYLDYEDGVTDGQEAKLFTKALATGWNIVGVADQSFNANDENYTEVDVDLAFDSLLNQFANIIDYTDDFGNGNDNFIDESNQISSTDTDDKSFEEFKAYPVFIRQGGASYGGSQKDNEETPPPE